jgi:hypothetical protein
VLDSEGEYDLGKLLATLPGSPPATSRRLADKPARGSPTQALPNPSGLEWAVTPPPLNGVKATAHNSREATY